MEIHSPGLDDILVTADDEAQAIDPAQVQKALGSKYIDLVSKSLGSRILSVTDEWFGAAENLTTPSEPIRKPGVFTYAGAWYDGWETRRHNPAEFDSVIFRLGVASGRCAAVEIDTAFFNGNHAPEIAVQAYLATDASSEADLEDPAFSLWDTILPRRACGPSRKHAWVLPARCTDKPYTHVRLQMFPDGGIARFRLYGSVAPVLPLDVDAVFDLAAATNGGLAIACSDQHFGTKDNLLLPGRGVDMGDGWETRRSRGVHVDWVIIKLGVSGYIDAVVVDTAHFRGNYPQKVQVFAAAAALGTVDHGPSHDDHDAWVEILPPSPTGPDQEHEYGTGQLHHVDHKMYTHVKLVIIPDGGVKRLRVIGRRCPSS